VTWKKIVVPGGQNHMDFAPQAREGNLSTVAVAAVNRVGVQSEIREISVRDAN